jgi:molybdopterin converting factor small subunit
MDTGILLRLIDDLIDDENEFKLNTNLNTLKTGLTQSKTNQPTAGKTIADNVALLKKNAISGYYERFTKSYFKTLEEIGGLDFFGENLLNKIDEIFEKEQYSVDNQIKEITKLHSERVAFIKKITETKTNLDFLNQEAHFHTDETYEIGIIIPDQNDLHYAKEFEDSIHNWNLIIKGLSELTGNGTEDIKIERVHNGCIELIIEQVFNVAASLGDILKELVSTYLIIEKVRNHIKGLKKEGVSQKNLKPIEDSQAEKLEEAVEKLTEKIIKEYKVKDLEKGRENELKTQLKKGIKYIAKSLEKGVEVEIIPPYSDVDEEEVADADDKETKDKKIESNKNKERIKDNINSIKDIGIVLKKTKEIQKGIFNLLEGGEGKIDEE